MNEKERKIPVPSILTEGLFHPQAEMLEIPIKKEKLFIGIPKEITLQENRIALTPSATATLTAHGHRVLIESDAGKKSNYSDHEYAEAGAEITVDAAAVYQAGTVIKVAPPTLQEIDLMHPNQVLISPLQMPTISQDYINRLRQKKVIALAMEYIKDNSNNFPVVRIMSELAGISAMLTAAELMSITGNGKGVLLGGISGVPSAKVVILGSGIVAEYATRTALGLGAEVRIFDNDIYKLKRLQNLVGRPLFTSAIDPYILEQELVSTDVAIGAMHSKSGRTPLVVGEEIVEKMRPGAVIVDVSIDQGGCFATSELTSLGNPTFVKHDIIHYCVPNIPSKVPRTASMAISNIISPMLMKASTLGGVEDFILHNAGMRHGVYAYKGHLTNEYLGRRFQIKYTDLELLLTSDLS